MWAIYLNFIAVVGYARGRCSNKNKLKRKIFILDIPRDILPDRQIEGASAVLCMRCIIAEKPLTMTPL